MRRALLGGWLLVFSLLAIAQPPWEALKDYKGKVVPETTFVDVDGKPHKLSSYRGKVVLLNFWSIY